MTKDQPKDDRKKARNAKRVEQMMQDTPASPEQPADAGAPKATLKGMPFRFKELLDQVASRTGSKKSDLRATVEATLEALGTALATGRDLNIPPLGKLRVAKNQPPVMTLKLRLADGPRAAGLALADEEEDS